MSHHSEFPDLPYAFDALEPYIDKQTMELHYTKHHRAYYDKFMAGLVGTDIEEAPILDVFKNVSKYSATIRNNSGGYYNHSLFWDIMSPNGGGNPGGQLAEAINTIFGSFDNFKDTFSAAGANRFGSGWAWLAADDNGKLFVSSTPNQDNPLMDVTESKGTPILGLDVWEHAYYLKYQNRRPEYIQAWWNVINWAEVEKRFNTVMAK